MRPKHHHTTTLPIALATRLPGESLKPRFAG
jgi:hypothetical protein